MAENTPNLGLLKKDPTVDGNDTFNIKTMLNDNWDKIDTAVGDSSEMKTAGGTGTAITLSIPSVNAYKANQKFTFIATADNAGNATTIKVNSLVAKPLYKPNTTTAPNLVAGKAYEVWYDSSSDCFFLKASAEGNATPDTVLAGHTFSNDDDSGITGTMTDNGAVNITIDTEGEEYTIPQGYHNGLGKVKALITGLVASVIKAGTTVGGILGTFTSDATATAGNILSGKTAYVNGNKVTGTMPSKGAQTFTPGTTNQTISSGQYLSGTQTILGDTDLVSSNIKAGANIFGVAGDSNVVDTSSGNLVAGAVLTGYQGYSDGNLVTGTLPDKYNNDNIVATTEVSGNTLKMNIPQTARYRGGYHLIATDNDWAPENIRSGVNIFGKTGTLISPIVTHVLNADYYDENYAYKFAGYIDKYDHNGTLIDSSVRIWDTSSYRAVHSDGNKIAIMAHSSTYMIRQVIDFTGTRHYFYKTSSNTNYDDAILAFWKEGQGACFAYRLVDNIYRYKYDVNFTQIAYDNSLTADAQEPNRAMGTKNYFRQHRFVNSDSFKVIDMNSPTALDEAFALDFANFNKYTDQIDLVTLQGVIV